MGYYVSTVSSKFTFKPGTDLTTVLQDVQKNMFSDRNGKDIADVAWYSWTNSRECRAATDIYQIIEQFFETVDIADDRMSFEVYVDNKIGQEDVLLEFLAPYLEDGSHLRYRGEDGDLFGWRVQDGALLEERATVTWD
jgi:hypothetical protein